MFADKSAITVLILFVVTVSLSGTDVNSEKFEQPNNTKISTQIKAKLTELATPSLKKHPKIQAVTTESPTIATSTSTEFVPDLDSRYGIDAPSATLIQCEPNQKYQDGVCKERSNL